LDAILNQAIHLPSICPPQPTSFHHLVGDFPTVCIPFLPHVQLNINSLLVFTLLRVLNTSISLGVQTSKSLDLLHNRCPFFSNQTSLVRFLNIYKYFSEARLLASCLTPVLEDKGLSFI
jgi:hypothetical protein